MNSFNVIILIVGLVLVICTMLIGIIVLFKLKSKTNDNASIFNKELIENTQKEIKKDIEQIHNLVVQVNNSQLELIKIYNASVVDNIKNLSTINVQELTKITEKLTQLTTSNENRMDKLIEITNNGLNSMQQSNEKKLEEMRLTVDEKLNTSLERRLNESFSLISQRLEAVTTGLGEMRSLASGVGDLKKVLTNVKTRGVFGEIQLNTLLEQMLAPNQYKSQAIIKPNSLDRVDFAINFPGKNNQTVLLPIDAKFPMEDYLRLVESVEKQDMAQIQLNQKALIKRIKEEAKSIKEKYINIPVTTDFAIMYLATEGLYCEVLKCEGLMETLQRDYKIIICGPTTISALLNSLQMGFKSIAIEKRSSEIWNMLCAFKKEFSVYVELLGKTQKKLNEATDTIENATKKSEKIQKQLAKVDDYEIERLISNQSEGTEE